MDDPSRSNGIAFMSIPLQEHMYLVNNQPVRGKKRDYSSCQALNTGFFAAAKAAVRNGLLADPGQPSLLRLQATLNDIDPHDASPKRQELPPPASRTNVPNPQDSNVTS